MGRHKKHTKKSPVKFHTDTIGDKFRQTVIAEALNDPLADVRPLLETIKLQY